MKGDINPGCFWFVMFVLALLFPEAMRFIVQAVLACAAIIAVVLMIGIATGETVENIWKDGGGMTHE